MAAPNIEGASTPQVVTGGEMGAVVGYSPTTTVGFYGATGNVQLSIGAAATANINDVTTLVNSIRSGLIDLGLFKA